MKVKKVLCVFGTRPEAIKIAPLLKEFEKHSNRFEIKVCITSQHKQMLDQVLNFFGITPDYDLDVMESNQSLPSLTSVMLDRLSKVIDEVNPDLIFIQGDTTTSFVGALSGFYRKIRIAHLEAGLRSYNKCSPFPEEVNRRMISIMADFNFAPTDWAKNNLLKEGVNSDTVFVTGNTVVDALYGIVGSTDFLAIEGVLKEKFPFLRSGKRIILITGHRRESFGQGFENICLAVKELTESFPDDIFVYPVHLNPNVKEPVHRMLNNDRLKNVFLIEPLDYLSFLFLMKNSYFILTDSGGVQEEAISFKKPILIMRDVTERPEGVEIGAAKLVGNNKQIIIDSCKELLLDNTKYSAMCKEKNPYGDGRSSEEVVKILKNKYVNII